MDKEKKEELAQALLDYVIRISKKEEATPGELRAMVGAASILANLYL